MTQLTCLACTVIFDDAVSQRTHYQSEWHRYNLKRKIAQLAPVTYGEFNCIVQLRTEKAEENVQEKVLACHACNKSFSSDNAYTNHLKSKKHKEKVDGCKTKESGSPAASVRKKHDDSKVKPPLESYVVDGSDSDQWEDVDEEEIEDDDGIEDEETSEALPPTFCLFCPHESVSLEDNFRHMTKSHSFFLPDFKYVVDVEGYFVYLGAKVGDGKVCLKCNNHSKQFQSTRACQMHMVDKQHCMLDSEADAMLEYSDFYDFSPSYPDDNENTIDVDDELSAAGSSNVSVDDETMELILPSGAHAGHRALNRYYKQNINPEETLLKNRRLIAGLDNHVRSLGLSATATLTVATRKKIHAMKMENVKRSDQRLRLSVKANKLQKHFRKQTEGGG